MARGMSPTPACAEIRKMGEQGGGQRQGHPGPCTAGECGAQGQHQADPGQEHQAKRRRGEPAPAVGAPKGETPPGETPRGGETPKGKTPPRGMPPRGAPQSQHDRLEGSEDQDQIDQVGRSEEGRQRHAH